MARIRTIKPEFWTSAQVMECSPTARLLFLGMLNFADDAGRMTYSPKTLKAQIFPSDDIPIDRIVGMVVELSSNGLVLIYSADNKEFISITGWHHQKRDKPRPSKLPGPFYDGSATVQRKVATDPILSNPSGNSAAIAAGAEAPPDPSQPERDFFRRGKEILGLKAGGQLTKLLNVCGGNVALARSKLELAATKHNAAEFIAGIIRAGPVQAHPVRQMTEYQRKQAESREVFNEIREFNARAGSASDYRNVRHDPGNGSEDVLGGPGRPLIELSAGSD